MFYMFSGIALESSILLALLSIKELKEIVNIMIVTLIVTAIVLGISQL